MSEHTPDTPPHRPADLTAADRNAPAVHRLYIDGQFVSASDGATFDSLNPYTGEVWARAAAATDADVDAAVAAARRAFDDGPWGRSTPQQRAAVLRKLADLVAREAEHFARLESTDNGKLYREMVGQWRYLPEWFHYYAGLATSAVGAVLPSDKPNFVAHTRRDPVGVVAAITPWNSPGLLMIWKLAPALAAGCTFVVKPSEHTPVSTAAFAQLAHEAGLPAGVFNVVTGDGRVGERLVAHPDVDKVAFTGSDAVGRRIAQAASGHFARVSLELGGKSAQVVFDDAEPEHAANGVISGIFAATGQTCMAGSRLLVQRGIADAVVGAIVARARRIKLGDPSDPATEMGPAATRAQYDKILAMIADARAEGATVAFGGGPGEPGGLFVAPTVLTGVRSDMRIVRDEVFGPVLCVQTFDDEAEAVRLANDTRYGLAAGIWTTDVRRANRVALRLRAGSIWINAYRTVGPFAPFGGFGHSGIGRENGPEGLAEFQETKTIWTELEGVRRDPFLLG
ncbi:aldehyde dehydrogenase [Chitinasiproducens palmae]|uniref:Aldehyde dehydrogenase (NAD+) n=1 Tax=Chitinasiproducens palmae TaxID=1770053 RepID=A0A1H2PQD7_9BURK|nr:aldehyde dehydrogenase [Chitinasiproducens palmae]SDV48958.1 aldehyde dehydrogenase (NAD+) [Chitinasiproducens palmae]